MTPVSAVVLAAGSSSRMREFKPLAEIGGQLLVERAVMSLRDAGVSDVTVVAGHRAGEVSDLTGRLGARAAVNRRYADGMYSSIQAGMAVLPDGPRKILLLPVDCALVRPETVGRVLRAAERVAGLIHYPAVGGRRGHPPVIDASLRGEILAAQPGGGLEALLATRDADAVDVRVEDPGVLLDIDTDDDLRRARSYAAGEGVPSAEECLALLRAWGTPEEVVGHSEAVAEASDRVTRALNQEDQHLCLPLVTAASLLHDIARTQPRHAEAGADLLERLGLVRVAAVVRRHIDLELEPACGIGEAEIVYLADKLVVGDRIVGLEAKWAQRRVAFAGRPNEAPFMETRMALAAEIARLMLETAPALSLEEFGAGAP